jgi:hypothetical protein
MNELSLFISHISEEKEIALVLKKWIEESFLERCKVFVSSSPEDIAPGQNWLEVIKSALHDAQVQILLCSPRALTRPWINFEAGFAWATEIQIIPLCHSKLTIAQLPIPLNLFQALDLTSSERCHDLFTAIAKKLDLKKAPPIDYTRFFQEISSCSVGIAEHSQSTEQAQQIIPQEQVPIDLPEECKSILKLFKKTEYIYDRHIRNLIRNNIKADYFRNLLLERELIAAVYNIMDDTRYHMTTTGTTYFVQQGLAED